MTDDMMNLRLLVEKSADSDLLREMIGFTAQRLMELEVGQVTGAAHGEKKRKLRLLRSTPLGIGRTIFGQRKWRPAGNMIQSKYVEFLSVKRRSCNHLPMNMYSIQRIRSNLWIE